MKFSYLYVAWSLRVRVSLWEVWSLALIIFLIMDPWWLFQVGFLLSFGVTAGLIGCLACYREAVLPWGRWNEFLPEKYYTWWQRGLDKCRRRLLDAFAVATMATMISLPISGWHFRIFNLNEYGQSTFVGYD